MSTREATAEQIAEAIIAAEKEREGVLADARFIVTVGAALPVFQKLTVRGNKYLIVHSGKGVYSSDTTAPTVIRQDGIPGAFVRGDEANYILPSMGTLAGLVISGFMFTGGMVILPLGLLIVIMGAWLALDVFVLRRFHQWDDNPTGANVISNITAKAAEMRAKYTKKATP